MTLNDRSKKKNKIINFVSKTKEYEDHGEEIISKAIALVERKFNKSLRRLNRNWSTNIPNKVSDISPLNKSKNDHKPNKGKWIQCHECEGFSHIKSEFPTF